MAKRKVYTARFELDEDGYWSVLAEVAPRKSAISDGQTLPKARRRIRQAIALLLEVDEGSFDIQDEFVLPRQAMSSLQRHRGAQEQLRQDSEQAARAARVAAQVLSKLGISRRDAGDLLGLSGARIQQVLNES
jgi:predicted RNase H-like HicB family nuclease